MRAKGFRDFEAVTLSTKEFSGGEGPQDRRLSRCGGIRRNRKSLTRNYPRIVSASQRKTKRRMREKAEDEGDPETTKIHDREGGKENASVSS